MQQHVKILAILHMVLGSLGILAGLIAFAVLDGLAAVANMRHPDLATGSFLGLIGVFAFLVLLCLSVPGLIAGIGLLSYQPWARILTIILSALELPAFPLHTALGIYGLWVLLSNQGSSLFSRPGSV